MSIGEKVSFWQFINGNDIKIEIPEIQRDYAQGRKDLKIEFSFDRLLKDMYAALFNSDLLDLNYIYGKIDNGIFIPIDGQQRLTTLLILHIYAFSKENKRKELNVLEQKFFYKTRITTQRFIEKLIDNLYKYFEEDEVKEIRNFIEDSEWFVLSWLRDPSVSSFINVIEKIDLKFKDTIFSNKLVDDNCGITYMALSIENMGNENELYIKMNSRGKSLTEFEIFKSDLFEYIESKIDSVNITQSFCNDFKTNIDTKWMSMIWDFKLNQKKYALDLANECDIFYLKLLHWILLNNILPSMNGKYDENTKKIIYNKGFFNFHNYSNKLSSKKIAKEIFYTLDLLDWIKNHDTNLFDYIFNNIITKAENNERKERVLLNAITSYAVVGYNEYSEKAFKDWFDIIEKLVKNTEIDTEEKYCKACISINNISAKCCADSIKYFASLDCENPNVAFFDKNQLKEEVVKAQLILSNESWYNPLKTAEKQAYFDGQIGFMLRLQGITSQNLLSGQEDIDHFNDNWKVICKILSKEMINKNDNILKRALLTFGNFSIGANSNDTFFFEGGNEYYNWRRLLREDKSFNVFKKFFSALKNDKATDVITNLEKYIDEYSGSEDYIYNLIKIPELFDYMSQNRFRKDTESNYKDRVILYKKERLSSQYVEAMSYALYAQLKKNGYNVSYHSGTGYLYDESSSAYIENINDIPTRIEYHSGCFYCNNTKMDGKNGKGISTVSSLLENIKKDITLIEL